MIYSFGEFTLDADRYVLRRGADVIPLEPKIFDVLRFLVDRRERVVHKQELLDALWPGEFVTDSVLPRCIATARKALGDDATRQTYIATAHGRGYRFVGELHDGGAGPEVPDAAADTRSPFIGRERELEQTDTWTGEAIAGRGRLIALAGEPGIGKTRTADEVLRRAGARGALCLEGRCYEGHGAPPFWPWVQALRAWLDAVGRDADHGELTRRVPELLSLLPELDPSGEASALATSEEGSSRFRLFDALGEALKQSTRKRPIALVLDDLHYADTASLELLRFLASDLHRRPMLIVATYRDVELRRGHPLAALLGELAREPCFVRLPLHGFGADEVARLLELQAPAARNAGLADEVHDMTDGNPFFVNEVASLLRDGASGALARRLPEGVREAVGRRLDLLADAAIEVLQVAAVIGREFSLGVLSRACERERAAVLEALDAASARRIVEALGDESQRYRFSHALVQQTLYEEIQTPQRVLLHERIGEALQGMHGDGDDAPLDEIAHHFFEAAASGRSERAVHFARRSAERAARLFAFEEAAAKYGQGLAALSLASDEDANRRLRCELLLEKGDQESRGGARAQSRETFLQALDRARKLADPQLFGRAALGFGGRGELGFGGDGRTAGFIEEALECLGSEAPGLRAKLLARLSGAPPHTYEMSRRRALSERSLALARESGELDALVLALSARGWALLGPDRLDERLRVTDELIQIASRPGGRSQGFLAYDPRFLAHEYRYLTYLCAGDMGAADRTLAELERAAQELREPIYWWYVNFFRASRAISAGDYAAALELIDATEATHPETVHPAAGFVCRGQRLWVHAQQGDYASVAEGLELLYDNTLTLKHFAKSAEAMLRSLMGDVDEARRCYEAVASAHFGSLEHDEAYLVQLGFLAELALEFEDRPRAAELLELLRPYTHLNATIDLLRIRDGSVAAYAGQAASALDAFDQAEAYFDRALEVDEATDCKSAAGSVRLHWAAMLLRRGRAGDRQRAQTLLGEAEAILARIGHGRRLGTARRLRSLL